MRKIKDHIQRSFRMEMIGAGLYDALAKQYGGQDSKLRERLHSFSNDERMHGKLFKKCSQKMYDESPGGEGFWLFVGKTIALAMRPLPLKSKLKKVSLAEQEAVERIEKILAQGNISQFHRVIRAILQDEKIHAGFYNERYSA